ncbi:MAG: aspartyl protease family protein [Bacteroidales bacterium]
MMNGSFFMDKTTIHLPLRLIAINPGGYHLMTQAAINGRKANVLLDTGASKSIMDLNRVKEYAKDPDIRPYEKAMTGMGADKINPFITTLSVVTFERARIDNLEVVLLDLGFINDFYASLDLPPIDMIAGGDLLFRMGVAIDYSRKLIRIRSDLPNT